MTVPYLLFPFSTLSVPRHSKKAIHFNQPAKTNHIKETFHLYNKLLRQIRDTIVKVAKGSERWLCILLSFFTGTLVPFPVLAAVKEDTSPY